VAIGAVFAAAWLFLLRVDPYRVTQAHDAGSVHA